MEIYHNARCGTLKFMHHFNWRKITNKCIGIVYLFLKFIYLLIYRTDMFRLFLSLHQGACYMVQCKKTSTQHQTEQH